MGRRFGGWAARAASAGSTGPADLGATLQHLHTTLREATVFRVPWDEFHDEVAEDPAFMSAGKPGRSELIEAALTASAAKLLGRRHPLEGPMFMHLAEHKFWHGMCRIGPFNVIFFYFEETDTGLAGLFRGLLSTNLELVRFSLIQVPEAAVFSRERGQA